MIFCSAGEGQGKRDPPKSGKKGCAKGKKPLLDGNRDPAGAFKKGGNAQEGDRKRRGPASGGGIDQFKRTVGLFSGKYLVFSQTGRKKVIPAAEHFRNRQPAGFIGNKQRTLYEGYWSDTLLGPKNELRALCPGSKGFRGPEKCLPWAEVPFKT